ncbi:hypothetical protein PPYR_03387 [Photinus pyralis]|uniref:Uncharacterized protein n=2 Tax=Photinus pyralis TaxID=7054 RepID=A0A5N4A2P4_PHOPY|nr:uncharacterized protein LOC116160993 [Photinus pyralis]KAB0791587.1 hypothetical protein PPYR_03387 [Photinus pyralis]
MSNGSLDLYAEESIDSEVTNSVGYSKSFATPFGPLHYMVGVAGVSLVLFIIYVVYQQAKFSQNQHQEQAPRETGGGCEHRFCARVQLTNSSCSCLLDTLARNPMVTERVGARPLRNARVTGYSSAYPQDLPPSYVSSVRYDCPPSYEEAITFNFNISQHI